jgi:hypothetical protein
VQQRMDFCSCVRSADGSLVEVDDQHHYATDAPISAGEFLTANELSSYAGPEIAWPPTPVAQQPNGHTISDQAERPRESRVSLHTV